MLMSGSVELKVENIANKTNIIKAASAFSKVIRSPFIKQCFSIEMKITPIAHNPNIFESQNVDKIISKEISRNSISSMFFIIELFFLNGSVKFCIVDKNRLILSKIKL